MINNKIRHYYGTLTDLRAEYAGRISSLPYNPNRDKSINHKLTLEMLKELSDLEYVVEVTGEYKDGITGIGASHEHRDM